MLILNLIKLKNLKKTKNICEFFGMKVEQLSNLKKEGESKGYQPFSKEDFNIETVSNSGKIKTKVCLSR